MRIAVINPFPNVPQVAEAEWIRRFGAACDRLGFEPVEVITSDDILRCNPDCVLATHEVSAKLTEFPTLGLHWNPPDFFAEDPARCKAVLSLDGHLCGSKSIADWINDFSVGHGKRAAIHDGLMLPSTPDFGPARSLPSEPAIFYAGIHWDGSRHGEIFRALDTHVSLRLYGPPTAWANHHAYRGSLPFDGVSIVEAIRDAGIALCLHKSAHRRANCPTMRLFEAAAAGALIITDDFEFPRYWLRDSVLYVKADSAPNMVVRQILSHLEWARDNSEAASRLAKRSNELFRQNLNLERMLTSLPEFVDQVRKRRSMVLVEATKHEIQPVVEYIVRVGLRPAKTVARALASLAAQTYQDIAIVLVQFHPVPGLDAVVDEFRSRFRWFRHIVVPNNGIRSTSWWAGLKALTADYFAMLDDDDSLFPNHVASLMDHFRRNPKCGFVYSGLIKYEEEPSHYVDAPQFYERRQIYVLSEEDFRNISPMNNVIGNHSWICRRSLLDNDMLVDPEIEWAEDVYFTVLMAERAQFGFTAMATALWHWRSATKDNWSLSHSNATAEASLARWQERLQAVRLPSHNRVAKPTSRYDLEKAVTEDLQFKSAKGVQVPQELNESSIVEFGRCENVTAKPLRLEPKAVYLEEDASFSRHRIEQVGIRVIPKQSYTVDIVARPRGRNHLMIEFRDSEHVAYARATFDLEQARVVARVNGDSVAIGPAGKEWVRCQLSITPTSDVAIFNMTLVDHDGAAIYQGRGQGGIDIRPPIVGRAAQIS